MQHDFFSLTDEEAVEIIVKFARLTIDEKDMFTVIRNCPFTGMERDFFVYLAGFEIGLYTGKVSNCPGIKCHECELQQTCNIALEGTFFTTIRRLLKQKGEKEAKEFVASTITKRRREIFEESKYIV